MICAQPSFKLGTYDDEFHYYFTDKKSVARLARFQRRSRRPRWDVARG